LLRFAAAAEILETDFWVQYNELGGVPNTSEVPGGSGNPAYTALLAAIDDDKPQYIHDNTDDEFTHQNFLNAYLEAKGAAPVNLEPFRTLPGSEAAGSSGKMRLTNLMQLTLDTSWYTRYRSSTHNPDLDPGFVFPQAVPDLNQGQHTAIPRTDADTGDANFLQAIVNTAVFHFPTIEQGGNSLYPSMAQRATHSEVLRILISIGPTETMQVSDLVGPRRRCSAADGNRSGLGCPGHFSGSQRRTIPERLHDRRFSDELDHARALPVPQPQAAAVFRDSPHRNQRRCRGRAEIPYRHGPTSGASLRPFSLCCTSSPKKPTPPAAAKACSTLSP
jgi:hypothetical protein